MNQDDLWSFVWGVPSGVVWGLVHAIFFPDDPGFWWAIALWAGACGFVSMFILRLFRHAGD